TATLAAGQGLGAFSQNGVTLTYGDASTYSGAISDLGTASVTITGDVVTNRVVTANGGLPIDFGVLHVGSSASQSLLLSTTGADSSYTRVAIADGTNGSVAVSGGNPTSAF